MDDNEKKELVKKILEQRKALWKGEDTNREKKSKESSPIIKNEFETKEDKEDTTMREIPVDITSDEPDNSNQGKRKTKFSLKEELRKTGDLGFKVIFAVIGMLIVALLFGIAIGFIITLDF
ncbi:TPA: hypothetical protein ENS27_16130 [bacterium]|nr:hypothetical protein [bacterium]